MIEVFKILNNLDKINSEIIFEMNNATLIRSNNMKLKYEYATQLFVSHTKLLVVDQWNRLPAKEVSYKTIDSFKS